jgi:hypothetical protein
MARHYLRGFPEPQVGKTFTAVEGLFQPGPHFLEFPKLAGVAGQKSCQVETFRRSFLINMAPLAFR